MNTLSLSEQISRTSYPGRGIVIGKSPDGKNAVCAYFIMGRSVNSRNRIFLEDGDGIRTQAFDPSKMSDPHLIIYAPVRVLGKKTIVTNGDQTDTIYQGLKDGLTFEQSLRSREFENDGPNWTPRISGLLEFDQGFKYSLSILKSDLGSGSSCNRFTFEYSAPQNGTGRFIHTYMGPGDPLPSFEGEPECVEIPSVDIDGWTNLIWDALDSENKISLWTRFIDIQTGTFQSRIVNKNG